MRLVQFYKGDGIVPGVLLGEDNILDLAAAARLYPETLACKCPDVRAILEQGDAAFRKIDAFLGEVGAALNKSTKQFSPEILRRRDEVTLAAPIHNPQKIMAIGLNYLDHCRENNLDPPEYPIMFAVLPSAIIGSGAPITWPPGISEQIDFEAEFAVVIGKKARLVPEKDALEYVAGYTIINDVSARDLQFADGQWVRAKSIDTFCPMGPCLVTRDEIPDPHALEIKCSLSGELMQHSNTSNLIFGVPALVSFLSKSFTLYPGDIISTGTPGGIGYYRKPPRFLQPGDTVTVEIENIGKLENPVAAWQAPA